MHGFWKTWMQTWWAVTILAGGGFLLAAIPGLDAPLLAFYDLIHWPFDGQSGFTEATRPTAAILGAVFLGFILAIGALMRLAEQAGQASPGIWRTTTAIMAIWYVTDSCVSVLTGVPVNAASNTVFFLGYLIPVLASGVMGAAGAASTRSA